MTLLRALQQAGVLRVLDDALAQSLRRLDPDTPDAVLAAAALASLAVSQGHAGFDPARPRQLTDADLPWPDADDWRQQLADSPWVATPATTDEQAAAAPLALEHGLLYLRRYREYERRLALQLRRIAAQPMPEADVTAIAPLFATLFPAAPIPTLPPQAGEGLTPRAAAATSPVPDTAPVPDTQPAPITSPVHGRGRAEGAGEGALRSAAPHPNPVPQAGEGATADPHQARAAALALRRALLLVTGGPGTGKTTTIARLLVLRIAQAAHAGQKSPRIALAAPTGRAAERMAESLRRASQQMTDLGVDTTLLEALPTDASTLHRLLGTIPDSPRFRHRADHPLPFDIVVVDEASMVDLPLMCKLAEAVGEGAQLILLGDPDQLPSVEAGDVLAAILAAAGPGDALSADDADALQPLLGSPPSLAREAHRRGPVGSSPSLACEARGGGPGRGALDPASATTTPLHGHRVHLRRGWRQDAALDLAPLAEAVRDGDARTVLALLRGDTLSNVYFHEGVDDPLQARPDLLAHWRTLATETDPAQALRQANRLRLLTALREGPQGARGLNARIESQLAGRRIGAPPAWFPGRLLLVTENSYRHQLFNGDVGLCLPGDDGTPLAWFPGNGGAGANEVRAFHPAALPAHESAFATTVHKAQGSEFDEVWLQLPRMDARVLSRELLYTGLTRARSALHIAGSAEVIETALSRHASRVSGLGWRLH
ncbi:exodeoxyribonuclease V subunit alpha [Luteimonas vadosa]|uniref:RecBCD enzyme subunit RecD n=1 Tax=Luteimonas vadosa TaxID=1165507 RepID=A0ABP9DQK4_9GAMM